MTVKHNLNIQGVSIKLENNRSIIKFDPKNVVPKHFIKIHSEVVGSKKRYVIRQCQSVRVHCKMSEFKVMQTQ